MTDLDVDVLAAALRRLLRDGDGPDDNPHVRRRHIVELMTEGRLNQAEAQLRQLLDKQWKVPENVYLLGILALLRGQFETAQLAIDRAFATKPWLSEVPAWCGALRERLSEAVDACPAWSYPKYRLRSDEFEHFGLTLTSALSTHFEHADTQLVQVGANDGVHTDPMYGWIVKYGWRALLVEPMPAPFVALEEQHRDRPNVVVANVAVADSNGTRTMWSDRGGRHAVSTFRPERNILRHERDLLTVDVDCMTFTTLMEQYGLDDLDILQIDTEGYDLEVMRLVDLDRFHPSVIHLEFYLLPIDERLELFDILDRHGYAWRSIGADLIAVDIDRYADQFGLMRAPHV